PTTIHRRYSFPTPCHRRVPSRRLPYSPPRRSSDLVDNEYLAPGQDGITVVNLPQDSFLGLGQIGLHPVQTNLPEAKKRILRQIHDSDPVLAGRKVLIVDEIGRASGRGIR